MRLPIVKKVVQFIDENDASQVEQSSGTADRDSRGTRYQRRRDGRIGELLSNMFGGLEVAQAVKDGANPKQALNDL